MSYYYLESRSKIFDILDNENSKLSIDELKKIIVQLHQDCLDYYYKEYDRIYADNIKLITYSAEANAFKICLELLEHLI